MAGKLAARVGGLSEAVFRERLGTEARCRAPLFERRWPEGFGCAGCGHAEPAGRKLLQRNRCKHRVPLTAGTMFPSTGLPLTTWSLAIHLPTSAKNGISSVELGRRLGVEQATAWTMRHKPMTVMPERGRGTRLARRIETDDACLGGRRRGKPGRGAAGKTPFGAAVETTHDRKPRRLRLLPVKGVRKKAAAALAKASLTAGSLVVTDGLSCRRAVAAAGRGHFAMRTGSGAQAAQWAPFSRVDPTLGDIKTATAGTYHKLGPAHAGRHLASLAWRFNRRFELDSQVTRLAHSAIHTAPHPHRTLVAG